METGISEGATVRFPESHKYIIIYHRIISFSLVANFLFCYLLTKQSHLKVRVAAVAGAFSRITPSSSAGGVAQFSRKQRNRDEKS